MRLPRNTKPLRGPLDAVPFISVLFLLLLFLLLCSTMVFVPGVPIELPQVKGLAGVPGPQAVMAVDTNGHFYFENQLLQEDELRQRLREVVEQSEKPVTLVVQADSNTRYEALVKVALIARDTGIARTLWATRPPLKPKPEAAGSTGISTNGP